MTWPDRTLRALYGMIAFVLMLIGLLAIVALAFWAGSRT